MTYDNKGIETWRQLGPSPFEGGHMEPESPATVSPEVAAFVERAVDRLDRQVANVLLQFKEQLSELKADLTAIENEISAADEYVREKLDAMSAGIARTEERVLSHLSHVPRRPPRNSRAN